MVEDAFGREVRATLRLLSEACASADEFAQAAGELFTQHPQFPIYRSFPAVGLLTGSRLLAELGDGPDRFATAKGMAAYAGARPFTWASDSSRKVLHRRIAANKRVTAYGHHWAFSTLTKSPECRAHYDRRHTAGDRHTAAPRRLFARLLSSLHHCLRHGQEFDASAWPRPSETPTG
ncbi:transposase [Kitasatospora sp. CB02891]|uniref:transposase n=1 Tax=Kitasatospora sp. CB02891 TaxID=2020329 RepID=UPI000C27CA03|nr:transposase [Kitasatospora sp. CB02891]PJN25672.1 hypothetical protein CG736_14995 [Kitasatospora sp. CB02891]